MKSKSKTKQFVSSVLVGVLALSLFFAFGIPQVKAVTVEELTAQINSLLATITALQAQISAIQGGGAAAGAGYTFTRNLKQGDTGEDARALQKALNAAGTLVASSGAGSPGNETSYFGPATRAAVVAFQNKYASEILAPVGLSAGTGFVGASTRAKLNSVGGAVAAAPAAPAAPRAPAAPAAPAVVVPAGSGLTVTAAAQQPSAQLAPINGARIPFTKVTFTASADGDVTVNGLVVERAGQSVDAVFDGIVLLDESGMQLGLAKTLNSSHQTTLTEPFTVKGGQSRTLTIAGNRTGTANSNHAGMVAGLSLVQVNTSATVNGSFPIAGTAQTINEGLTIGSVTMNRGSIDPGTSVTKEVGVTGYTFSAIRITAGSAENIRLKSIRWNQTGSVGTVDLANLKTYVDGTAYDAVVSSDGKFYTSTFGSGLVIEKGFSKEVSIKGDVIGGSGRTIDFDVAKRTDINVNGELYGFGITPPLAGSAATADGAAFNNADDYYYDAAQVTISNGTINVSVSSSAAPAQNIAVNTSNQVLGAVTVDVKGEGITVGRIAFNVTLTSESAADVDDLTNVSLVDENGSVVAGPVDGTATDNANTASSGDGVITFTDTVTFPVGMRTYTLKGKVGTDFPNNATIQASTTPSSDFATVRGLTTGNTITPAPTSAITTNQMTVKAGALTVSVSTVPIAQNVIAGAKEFEFARYALDATASGEDIRVTTIPLSFMTNGAAVRTDLTNCQLYDGATSFTTGSNVKNPATSDTASSTTLTFDGTGLVVAKGTLKTLSLKCNVSTAATGSYRWGLDDGQQTAYTGATGLASAQTIAETLTESNGQVMTASAGGTLTVAIDDNTPAYKIVAAGTTGIEFVRVKFTATNEDIELRQVALQISLNASNTPIDLAGRIVSLYDAAKPTVAIATATFDETKETATSSPIASGAFKIPRGSAKVLIVKGDINSMSSDGPLTASGDLIAVDYDGDNEGINGNYGVGLASGTNVTPSAADTAAAGVRIMRSYPVVEAIALSATEKELAAGQTSNKPIYKFKVSAVGGPGAADRGDSIALYKMGFEIGSSTLAATTSLYSLYAYTDAFSTLDSTFVSTGLVNAGSCFNILGSTAAGPREVNIYPDKTGCNQGTTTYKIPVGQSRWFQLRATVASVESGTTNIDSITVRLAGDAAFPTGVSTLMLKASVVDDDANDDFIWSPISTTTSSAIGDLDFTNGYQITGLPDVGSTEESLQSK